KCPFPCFVRVALHHPHSPRSRPAVLLSPPLVSTHTSSPLKEGHALATTLERTFLPAASNLPSRKNYGRLPEVLPLPNLIETQLQSFQWFCDEGLRELFAEISPISDFTGKTLELHFLDYASRALLRQADPVSRRVARVRDVEQGRNLGQGRSQAQAHGHDAAARDRSRGERDPQDRFDRGDRVALRRHRQQPGAPVHRLDV